jgi:PilZ domain-containing protein
MGMPEHVPAGDDRRLRPRFTCGGLARIHLLSSDGLVVPGKIRNLGLGGCCVDTAVPMDCGTRAEIIARVKAASFRAMGEVRAIRGDSSVCVEFVHMSTGGKGLLEDLIADLARLQAFMNQLKSARREMDAETFRKELARGRLRAERLSERFPILGTILHAESVERNSEAAPAGKDRSAEIQPLVIRVDLFG